MARVMLLQCLALLVVGAHGTSLSTGVSPVQKVIELLDENKVKVAADLAAEEKEMEEYATYCDDTLTAKGFAIKTATRTISELTAEIEDGESQVASGNDAVVSVGAEMAAKEKQLAEAHAERTTEQEEFEKTEKELVESIDELERAVLTIKKDVSFVQNAGAVRESQKKNVRAVMKVIAKILSATWVNQKTFKALKGFVQTGLDASDDLNLKQAPEVKAYESQTGGIMGQLEDMKEKAEEQLSDARNGEMRSKHSFDMMAQSLTDAIGVSKEKLAKTKQAIESATEEVGQAKSELQETEKTKMSDEMFVTSLSKECTDSREEWATRQESAKEEMAVIEKAKSILSEKVTAFVQNKRDDPAVPVSKEQRVRDSVVQKLQTMSRKFKSYALMEMVSAAQADPFEKIRGLIEEMISKLVAQANAEATQKGFCDEETAKSTAAKEEKTMTLDKLDSRLAKATTTQAELTEAVKGLEADLATLDKDTAEAIKIRKEEHMTYMKSSKDFKDSAEAVSAAISTLKEYYEGASFAQVSSSRAPKFGGAKTDSASVILSILEMSAENFQKMYLQAETEEREAAAAHEKLMKENTVSRAAMAAEVKGAESEIKSLQVAVNSATEDKTFTSSELESVMSYLEKLKPQCEIKVMSYAEKKSRREAEIEGLKEALTLLESAALVQTSGRLLRAGTRRA